MFSDTGADGFAGMEPVAELAEPAVELPVAAGAEVVDDPLLGAEQEPSARAITAVTAPR
jgi:hypothetical protein